MEGLEKALPNSPKPDDSLKFELLVNAGFLKTQWQDLSHVGIAWKKTIKMCIFLPTEQPGSYIVQASL